MVVVGSKRDSRMLEQDIVEGELRRECADKVNYSFQFRSTGVSFQFVSGEKEWHGTMRLKDWQQGLVFRLGSRQKVKACYSFDDQSVCYFWVEFAEGQSECPMTFRIGDREPLFFSGSIDAAAVRHALARHSSSDSAPDD